MQKYLRQLLADLRAAARPDVPCNTVRVSTSIEEHFAEVEAWLEGTMPTERIGNLLRLEAVQFPPAEKLNRRQLRAVCEAFERTMATYSVSFNMPDRLPWKTRYKLLVSKIDHGVEICDEGFIIVEFCEYEPEQCPFGRRYCACKKIADSLPDFHLHLSEEAQALIQHIRAARDVLPEHQLFHIWESSDDAENRDLELLGKPICEWLGMDMSRFPPNEDVGYDDTLGITDAIIDLFPHQSWTWIIDASLTERYETCLALLKVKATYDYTGNFHTDKDELVFFNHIADFYFDRRQRRKDEGYFDYGPDDMPF